MRTSFIYPDINLVNFHLTYTSNRCTQMILNGITSQPSKKIYETIVSCASQQCLLISSRRIMTHNFWSRVGNFYWIIVKIGVNFAGRCQTKCVLANTYSYYNPLSIFWRGSLD